MENAARWRQFRRSTSRRCDKSDLSRRYVTAAPRRSAAVAARASIERDIWLPTRARQHHLWLAPMRAIAAASFFHRNVRRPAFTPASRLSPAKFGQSRLIRSTPAPHGVRAVGAVIAPIIAED